MKSVTATPFCKLCFKPADGLFAPTLFQGPKRICASCYRELGPYVKYIRVQGYRTAKIFTYGRAFQRAMYQCKVLGDKEIAPLFLAFLAPYLSRHFRDCIIVPVPKDPFEEDARGFDLLKEIYSPLHLPYVPALEKTEGALIRFLPSYSVRGKTILLVDDVIHSGKTILQCAKVLEMHGANTIRVLVLAKGTKKTI